MDPLSVVLARALYRRRRRLLVFLGLRRITPRRGEPLPFRLVIVEELGDTGGGYRPKHRPQDPAKDPREPFGSESTSTGQDHGWSGCTMSAGADVLAYQTLGGLALWGGDLRHEQADLDGGTDLWDLRDAWEAFGEELTIRSGAGWAALVDAHEAGRAIVVQGSGQVPGSGDYTGGHACAIGPETHSDGRWLFGDPLCSDWQWISPSAIRSWAEAWQGSIAFAVSRIVEPEPEPEPPPKPVPVTEPCHSDAELDAAIAYAVDHAVTHAGDELVGTWLEWLRAPRPLPCDRWDRGSWADPELELEELVDGEPTEPCEPGAPAAWARGRMPAPVADALDALLEPPAWGLSGWRGAAWMAPDAALRRTR